MKTQYAIIAGGIAGYLLTAGLQIPFPSSSFWYFLFGLIVIGIIISRTYFKINDDCHPGEF